MIGTLPPQNLEAESGVLSGVLRGSEAAHEVFEILTADDFYLDRHALIFEALRSLYDRGAAIDGLMTGEELRRLGTFDRVGGDAAILDILDSTPHAAMTAYYAVLVLEKAGKRRMIQALESALRTCYSPTSGLADCQDAAEASIFAVSEAGTAGARPVAELAREALDRLDRRRAGEYSGVPTGLDPLDAMTDGLPDGSLVILAARPSMGKTQLALNVAEHAALRAGVPTLFVSLEMDGVELGERLLVARSGVAGFRVRTGCGLSDDDGRRLDDAYGQLRDSGRFWVDDAPLRTVSQIAAIARRHKARHGAGLVVIDYLQLIDPGRDGGQKASRQEQVAAMSRRLKVLAKELSLPVLVLSQLNRQAEAREGHRPRMSDLRESGSIEQDADLVLLLHRPDYYDPNDAPGTAELIVAKNRHGGTGTVRLAFLKAHARFGLLDPRDADDGFDPDPDF